MADITVDPPRVGPIGHDGDDCKAMMFDQPPGDRGAGVVEFGRAVRGFAQQHDAGITETIEDCAECVRLFGRRQDLGMVAQHGDKAVGCGPVQLVARCGGAHVVLPRLIGPAICIRPKIQKPG